MPQLIIPRQTLAKNRRPTTVPGPQIAAAQAHARDAMKKRASREAMRPPLAVNAAARARSARDTEFAQRAAVAQNAERAQRKANEAARAQLKKQVQRQSYSDLEAMAQKQMAEQHAINPNWPHGMGWSLQRATITGASSPVAVAATIQEKPLPPVVATRLSGFGQVAPAERAPSPLLQAKTGERPTLDVNEVNAVVAAQTKGEKKIWPWLLAAGAGLLVINRMRAA